MKRASLALILALSATNAQADTARIVCDHFRGTRVQFFDNPLAPKGQNRSVVVKGDAISGARVEITYSRSNSDAVMVSTGNVNIGGAVSGTRLTKVESNDLISFVGLDSEDGAIYLLSYHPKLKKLLWSGHNDRIFFVDQGVVGKVFIADCR